MVLLESVLAMGSTIEVLWGLLGADWIMYGSTGCIYKAIPGVLQLEMVFCMVWKGVLGAG